MISNDTTLRSVQEADGVGITVPALEVDAISKTYGEGSTAHHAIAEITFDVAPGEIVCVVGPSGCGKTTLLKSIAGLLKPTTGETRVHGQVVTGPPADLAVVFQDYSRSLFPWLTVEDNVALPLRSQKVPRREIALRVRESLTAVGLDGFGSRRPYQLSGGMQQRVAIARALAYQPRVLLMDEPFASVDAQTRADLEDLVRATRDRFNVGIVFITHDIDESVYLADRVVVLGPPPTSVREIVEVDLPRDRDQVTTKELQRFATLRAHVYRAIRHQRED